MLFLFVNKHYLFATIFVDLLVNMLDLLIIVDDLLMNDLLLFTL